MYYATLSPCCDAPMESNCPTCRDPHCKECGLPVYPDMRPEHEVKFGTLQSDGQVTNVRQIKQSDIMACPHSIMVPTHYRPDGSCKCDDATERAMMINEWGYNPDDFKGPVRTKFTDVTTGIQWDCSSCPAWGLSPNKDGAKVEAAKHSCIAREEAKS